MNLDKFEAAKDVTKGSCFSALERIHPYLRGAILNLFFKGNVDGFVYCSYEAKGDIF